MAYQFSVDSERPVLLDHFPGNPLVPGALILDHVLLGLGGLPDIDRRIGLKEIKFKGPLRGNETARVTYHSSTHGIRFKVEVDTREIASGLLSVTEHLKHSK